jgi:hypothetical protein
MLMNDITIQTQSLQKSALVIAVLALGLLLLGYVNDAEQFFYSYLNAYLFWLTISLGAHFLLMLHHLIGATWSVGLRRLLELMQSGFLLFFLLFLPILAGLPVLFHWTHAEAVAADPVLRLKTPFLNVPFFIIRSVGYFIIWYIFSRTLFKRSILQENPTAADQWPGMRRVSAGGMILFALTLTFAAFDWIMSLDAHWYSTIFGVYIFSGSVLSALACLTLVTLYLRRKGLLTSYITMEQYQDLGRLLFTFTIFWAYMAFSQYFLIWYGNIPEETIWFQHRWHDGWKTISMLLVFGHFVIPFFLLMMHWSKRNLNTLACLSLWLLAMHWLDLFWLIMPTRSHCEHLFSWQDLIAFMAIGAIWLWYLSWIGERHNLVPVGDPDLPR